MTTCMFLCVDCCSVRFAGVNAHQRLGNARNRLAVAIYTFSHLRTHDPHDNYCNHSRHGNWLVYNLYGETWVRVFVHHAGREVSCLTLFFRAEREHLFCFSGPVEGARLPLEGVHHQMVRPTVPAARLRHRV